VCSSDLIYNGLVIQAIEDGILQSWKKDLAQELRAHSASASMAQQDRLRGRDRNGTT
jgi:hypothetical protein